MVSHEMLAGPETADFVTEYVWKCRFGVPPGCRWDPKPYTLNTEL